MASNEPGSRIGLCEHGLVRTLCKDCRQALWDAQAQVVADARYVPPARPHKRPVKEKPEERVGCASCTTRGTARELVEDVDARRFVCRTHARDRLFAHVSYTTSGRVVDVPAPTPAHWKDILRDSRATSIRAFTRPPAGAPTTN